MSWNYRVMKIDNALDDDWFEIHEVYYTARGRPQMRTENAPGVCSESLENLRWQLFRMLEATEKDVLTDADFKPKTKRTRKKAA